MFPRLLLTVWLLSTSALADEADACQRGALETAAQEPTPWNAPLPVTAKPTADSKPKNTGPIQIALTSGMSPAEKARAKTERNGELLLKGIDVDRREESSPLSRTLPANDPGLSTLRDYGNYLSHGNKMFDDESSLAALAERTRGGEKPDLGGDPGNWATHGRDHSYNIGTLGVEAVQQLKDAGFLKDLGTDTDALKVGAALLGVSHDMGMYHPEKESRENHWRVVGILAFGGEVEKLGLQKKLLDAAVDKLAQDKNNPLVKLLYQVADTELVKQKYAGSESSERAKTLIREFLMGNYSHGSAKGEFDPILGADHLGQRRLDYLRQLIEPFEHEKTAPQLEKYYRDGKYADSFMAWANPEATKNLPEDHPIKRLQKVFSGAESILNYADANRSRGPGMIFAAGSTQVVRYQNPDGSLSAYGVKVDPSNGKKLLVELGVRQFAGTNVLPLSLRGDPPEFTMSVVHTKFNSEESSKIAAEQTGRVIGETTAYAYRALSDILSQGKTSGELPKLKVAYPGLTGESGTFKKELEKSISTSMAKVLIRNQLIPQDILSASGYDPATKEIPGAIQAFVASKYWEFEDGSHSELYQAKANDPKESQRLQEAKQNPLSSKELDTYTNWIVEAGAYGKPRQVKTSEGIIDYHPSLLLKGAGKITLKPGEKLLQAGAARGNIYLLLKGEVRGSHLAGNGKDDFQYQGDGKSLSTIGATAYLTANDPGRNASITVVGEAPAEFIVIPPETARKYWRPSTLATPASEVPAQLDLMYGPGRR